MDHVLICKCGEVMLKSTSDATKLRSKIIVFREGKAVAICKGCGAELPVPIKLDTVDLIQKSRNPRLFLVK